MKKLNFPYLPVKQANRQFILTKLPAGVLSNISYTAVRGKSQEEGAVQRLLNSRRISSVKNFTLDVGEYPGDIVLNWTNEENPIIKNNGCISFEQTTRSAQIIDGQHRLAGIKEAIKENRKVADLEIPVVIYENLTTSECADIFLSINTEQKTVPRSLVFDLYGVASEPMVDPAALRARDIAIFLNEVQDSPYYDNIKFPGISRRRGGIALSTVVTAIKPLVEEKGEFERIGIRELERQKRILLNFFQVLQKKYGKKWNEATNAFQFASGFVGAIEFLKLKIIPYCNERRSFEFETINKVIKLNKNNLIYQSQVKGLSGKKAQTEIYLLLVDAFNPKTEKFEFKI